MVLFDRDADLAAADAVLCEVLDAGTGQTLAVTGPPGIGKTGLLQEVVRRASARGFRVLRATAGELESDLPFGVARQLLADADAARLTGAAAAALGREVGARADVDTDVRTAELRALDALYGLCVGVAAEQPVLLAVDDAHWADAASVKFLLYVARRLADLPIVLAVAVRSAGTSAWSSELALLLEQVDHELELSALSAASTAELVATWLGDHGDEGFARACVDTTGGNPLLLRELLAEAAEERLPPVEQSSARLREMGSTTVARNALLRVSRLGEVAVAVAGAAALLGSRATVPLVAAVAKVRPADVELVLDGLVEAHLLLPGQPLRFVHPIVQSAIYRHMPAGLRSHRHREAARLLTLAGVDDDEISRHLLRSVPTGDPWVLAHLQLSGLRALQSGAPEVAVRVLRRALEEDPTDVDVGTLLELGQAETLVQAPEALEHLWQAFAAAPPGPLRNSAALPLARILAYRRRYAEALDVLDSAIAATGPDDREMWLRLSSERLWLRESGDVTPADLVAEVEELAGGLTGATHGERLALEHLATARLFRGAPDTEVRRLAHLALGDGALLREDGPESPNWLHAASLLWVAGDYDEGEQELLRGEQAAHDRGALASLVQIRVARAWLSCELGDLRRAELLSRDVLARGGGRRSLAKRYARSCLATVLVETDRLDGAAALLDELPPPSYPMDWFDTLLLHVRAELLLARGDDRGVDLLLDVGHWCTERGIDNPAAWSWRTDVAPALADRGEGEEAQRLMAEELARARAFGLARPLGRALHASALVAPPDDRLPLLQEAVDVLAASPARLAAAKASLALGAHLRRSGAVADAQPVLRSALALADECGAQRLVQDAHRLLLSVGARPRRAAVTGPQALTPMEREVAAHAVEGLTNREIARRLYISVKAVEKHLRNAYAKLGIERRTELAAALGDVAEDISDRTG